MKNAELQARNVAHAPSRARILSAFAFAAAVFLDTLREIFDEAAYGRFLRREGVASSRQAYAAFLRENCRGREHRARCC